MIRPGPSTILYLNLYATMGGAERTLIELLAALDPTRYRPLVVLGEEGPLAVLLRGRGVEVAVVPFPTPPLHRLLIPPVLLAEWKAARRLARMVGERGVRIAHCGDLLALLLLLPAALRGLRIVYQVNYLGGWPRRLILRLLSSAVIDVLVVYSADQRRALGHLGRRAVVVHPGIEPREYEDGDGRAFRQSVNVAGARPLVGLLARYDTWKGHRAFLEAAALVLRDRSDTVFCMVGGALNQESLPHVTRYQEDVLRWRRDLGLEEAVIVVGHRDDVPDVLAGLDVVACPSEREPFGMVVLEALAARRAVVASDSGGPAEILEDGRSGLLFPTGDAQALAERIRRLLDDLELRSRLGCAGRQRVEAAFHRDRYARDVEALYDRLA